MMSDEFEELDLSGLEIEEDAPKRTMRKPRSDTGKPRGRRPKVTALADQLLVPVATLTTILSMAVPMTAHVMKGQAHSMVTAGLALAAPHPKMMAALEKVAKVGPASDLATGFALIGITLAVELGRMPHDNPLARSLGITDLYDQFYQPQDAQQAQQAQQYANQAMPPQYNYGTYANAG